MLSGSAAKLGSTGRGITLSDNRIRFGSNAIKKHIWGKHGNNMTRNKHLSTAEKKCSSQNIPKYIFFKFYLQ